jgi:NADH-ubiquinone oxidoreductase chain 6
LIIIFEIFYIFIYITRIIIRTIFCFIKHPLAIGLILLFQTLLVCLITGIFAKRFWFSYVLFLIFLGGILVLFIYVTSLASNEIFSFSVKIFRIRGFIFLINILFFYFLDKNLIINLIQNNETFILDNINSYLLENSLILNKLYNFPINLLTILLIIYLFLTLIAAVKITNIFEGPLRPK